MSGGRIQASGMMARAAKRTRFVAGAALALLVALLMALAACGPGGPSETVRQRTGPVWTPTATQTATQTAGTPVPGREGDWPTFDDDAARSGVNPNETTIALGTLGRLHRLWTATLPKTADSTPILLHDLTFADGSHHDVLYLTTLDGSLVALDATHGTRLWVKRTTGVKITNSSPVADPARTSVYSYGLDGRLHKYNAVTGDEVSGGGWPVLITRFTATEKESSALNAANGYVYVTTSGYIGDAPPYQGHVVAVRLADGTSTVFNSLCADKTHLLAQGECPDNQSGIWARAGVTVDPVTGNVFAATGNGPFTGNQGGHNWGDTVLELSADLTRLVDTYTPATYQALDQGDQDLGSMAPALLPKIPNSRTPYLAAQAGKDGVLRLLDRQNLSGQGGPGHVGGALSTIGTPGGCGVLTQPAVWTDPAGAVWLFVTDSCGTAGYQVSTAADGSTTLHQVWSIPQGATSPVVAGGVLFAATGGAVFALDPATGRQHWTSTQHSAGGSVGDIHWESPIVVGGRLYCSDQNGHVTAYGV
jgi:outer membrane protein assembly factor BamB